MGRRYSFYPGCTLHSTGVEFGLSTGMVSEALGMELEEIPDWNCCGASSAHSMDEELHLLLPGRNLIKAQGVEGGESLAIPCAACYSRMAAAVVALGADGGLRAKLEGVVGEAYEGVVRPRSLLEVVVRDYSEEELGERVRVPLRGLKVASYYGCLLVRPPEYTGRWDDVEHPRSMDELMGMLGAEVVAWSYGVDCCGGSLTLNRSDVVVHLVDKLVEGAREAGAEALVTACPMCMANVDGRQKYRGGLPYIGGV
jgi:heterodisulfide reductase subunit B